MSDNNDAMEMNVNSMPNIHREQKILVDANLGKQDSLDNLGADLTVTLKRKNQLNNGNKSISKMNTGNAFSNKSKTVTQTGQQSPKSSRMPSSLRDNNQLIQPPIRNTEETIITTVSNQNEVKIPVVQTEKEKSQFKKPRALQIEIGQKQKNDEIQYLPKNTEESDENIRVIKAGLINEAWKQATQDQSSFQFGAQRGGFGAFHYDPQNKSIGVGDDNSILYNTREYPLRPIEEIQNFEQSQNHFQTIQDGFPVRKSTKVQGVYIRQHRQNEGVLQVAGSALNSIPVTLLQSPQQQILHQTPEQQQLLQQQVSGGDSISLSSNRRKQMIEIGKSAAVTITQEFKGNDPKSARKITKDRHKKSQEQLMKDMKAKYVLEESNDLNFQTIDPNTFYNENILHEGAKLRKSIYSDNQTKVSSVNTKQRGTKIGFGRDSWALTKGTVNSNHVSSVHESAKNLLSARQHRKGINGIVASGSISFRQMHKNLARKLISSANPHREQDDEFQGRMVFSEQGHGEKMTGKYSRNNFSSKDSMVQLNQGKNQERIVSDGRTRTAALQDQKRKTEVRYSQPRGAKSGNATHRQNKRNMFQNSIAEKLEKSPTADDMQFGEPGLDEQFFRKNYSTISQTQQKVIHLNQGNKNAAGMHIQESTASKTNMASTVSKSLLNQRAQRNPGSKTKSKSTSRNRQGSVPKKRKIDSDLFGRELTDKQKQIAEFRKQKGQKEDQDPFGIENDDYEKNRMKKLMKLKKQKHIKSADRESDEDAESPEIKTSKVDKRIKDQATIIDYPRHIRISSQIESLEQVRENLREQKFFYHKFDPLKSDYASQHIYKNVYTENEKINPYDEKKLSANEYIRFNCPENMNSEPTMALTKNAGKQEDRMGVRDNTKYRTMSLAEQQYFKRMKNRPTELLRMWAHKNAKYDMQDQSEEKNSSSQVQENTNELEEVPLKVPAHRMAYINNEIDKKTLGVYKHNSSFANQRRMIETQMDQGMVIQVNDYEKSDGKVFEAAINKILKSQRALDKKQGNLKTSYFQAKREEEERKRRELIVQEQESANTLDRSGIRSSGPNEVAVTIPTQNSVCSDGDARSQKGIESFLKSGSPTMKKGRAESPSPGEPPRSPARRPTQKRTADLDKTTSTIHVGSKKNMEMNDLKKLIDNALKLNQKKPSASPQKGQPGKQLIIKEPASKRSSSPEHGSFHSGEARGSKLDRSSPLHFLDGEQGLKRTVQPSSKQINNDIFKLSEIPEKADSPMSLRNKKVSKQSQGGSYTKLPRPREDSDGKTPKGSALRNFASTAKSFKMQKIKNASSTGQTQDQGPKAGENIKIEIQGQTEQVTTETDDDGQVVISLQESASVSKTSKQEREDRFKVNFPSNIIRSHDDREPSPVPSVKGSGWDAMLKNDQDVKLRGDIAKKRAIHDAKIILKDQQKQRKKNKQASDKSPLQDEQSTTNQIKRQLELRKIKQRLKEGGYEDILNQVDFEKNYNKISKDNYLKSKELELKQVKDQENLMAQIEESVNDQFSSSLSTTRIQDDIMSNGRSLTTSKNNIMFIVKSPLGSQARSRSRQNGGVLSAVGNPLHSSHNSSNLFQTLEANIPVRLSQNVGKIDGDFTNSGRTRVVLKSPLNSLPCSNRSSSKGSDDGANRNSNKKNNRYGGKQSQRTTQRLPVVDFSKTSPDIERKITQYIKKISKGQNAIIKEKESQTSLNQIPNQDINDLNLILRQCFSEKEFTREDLGPKIDASANQIYDYNCKYLMAVSKLQENLIILEEQNKNNIDAHEYESNFNAKQIMLDQKRNDEENFVNILKKDDKGFGAKKDLNNQNQMRLLLGGALAGGKSKIWKPNKMEFGKDLKYLQFMNFNAQSGTMKLSKKKKQTEKEEKKKKAGVTA